MISIKGRIGRFMMRVFALFPLQKKVVFSSFDGNNYGDNPKAVFEKLQDIHATARIIWLLYDDRKVIEGANVVKAYSIKALYHQATAKVWVFNSRQREWMVKRKGQTYIQTWHGNIAMKKIEKDALDRLPEYYVKEAKHDSEMADLFLSDSEWLTKNYREAYWYGGPVLEKGLPREDLLYSPHMPFRNHLIEENDYPKDTRFVLYAPTFRNSGDLSCYDIDFLRLIQTLENKTGNTWKIIIRLHPNIQDKQNSIKYDSDVLNGSKYSDINELILASDLFISDYSSCIFDAVIANVPSIIYASDIDDFTEHERGLFFSWDELPFAITRNNNELNSAIEEINVHDYLIKASNFMERCGFIKNEHASADVADYILNVISGSINCYGK